MKQGPLIALSILLTCSLLNLSGCVSRNKPNIPSPETILEIEYIEQKNFTLADELKKIPEIQDGIDLDDRIALQRLSDFHKTYESDFETAFGEMYKIGLPEYRKYCSPLQAFFWLAARGSVSAMKKCIKPFDLECLLDNAWTYGPDLGSDTILRIVGSMKDPILRNELKNRLSEDQGYMVEIIINEVITSPDDFESWALERINRAAKNNAWSEYDMVLDRINAPELVHHYVQKQIRYEYYYDIPNYNHYNPPKHYVFNEKSGDCLYISDFIARALRLNGYKALIEEKPPTDGVGIFHAVCVFYDKGKKYIIDDGKKQYAGSPRAIIEYNEYRFE